MSKKQFNIAIIGLGFGAEFIPIYQKHPLANMYAICQRNKEKAEEIGKAFGIEKVYTDYDELLKDPNIDAVHINTPIQNHAEQSIKALKAGKHVACTVPMATTVEECRQIVELTEQTGLTYMMMETVIYSREFLFVKEMYEKGELGKIQFLRASHQQEMAGWPGYWEGLPPMHYATHCVGPVLALPKGQAEYVSCLGSGRIDENLIPKYGSPFAIETCHIKLKDSDLAAEVTRSLFNTARQYRESFDVYGSKKSFEWTLIEHEDSVMHEGEIPSRVKIPDFAHLLPDEIAPFTTQGVYDSDDNQHLSFIQGSGHGGSHPHLVHEFLTALAEERAPYPDARQSANITCVGILAHESAMEGGKIKYLPEFTLSKK
ncbi:Gfo/Idh/MocA family oxidoreductase [Algoriphagus sp. CAU 1675]|uniref:Gfo/Idh/MocA family protein n=1 Tax=Algoriphagus sp. CAU 1675 TaxID=3032597 RepID=UPI0023DB549D|nr:Gfo/Idh/MocA family oxidoreductase [Algoriphagus sp. CAU 1675]MDF2157935.1 Gfo/Idh/MocA family oxidoreductase [Algoriphagus sp. CAU 1675]